MLFENVDFTQLVKVLAYLSGVAGAIAWVVAWSTLLRNIRENPADKLSLPGRKLKQWLESEWRNTPEFAWVFYHGGAVIVPGIAAVITHFVPEEMILRLQPVYAWLTMMYGALTFGSFYYQLTKPKPAPAAAVQNVYNQAAPEGGDSTKNQTTMVVGQPMTAPPAPSLPPSEPLTGPVGLSGGIGDAFRGSSAAHLIAKQGYTMYPQRNARRSYGGI